MKLSFEERRKIEQELRDLKMEVLSSEGLAASHASFGRGSRFSEVALIKAKISNLERELKGAQDRKIEEPKKHTRIFSYLVQAVLIGMACLAIFRGMG